MKKLVVYLNVKDNEYVNLPVTKIEKTENVVFAYRDGEFIGMFDLGALEILYVSDYKGGAA